MNQPPLRSLPMKLPCACIALIFTAAAAVAADPAPVSPASGRPELRGVMDLGSGRHYLLASPGGATSAWEKVGDSFGDWTLAGYKEGEKTLVLKGSDATELDLVLGASAAGESDTKATLADAEAVLHKMNFERMIQRTIDQQRKALAAMTQQMAARAGGGKGADPQALADFQRKVMDVLMSAMDPKQMEADTASIYSDLFTKEQLNGLGDFYDSPAGQAYSDQQPEIQRRMQQLMIPRMMALMPQVQAMGRAFAQQQKAAAAAAAAANGVAPAPAASP
jgi:hypothetical protein